MELTLAHDPASVRKASVVNGTWLVQWPDPHGAAARPKASLRAGDESGQLSAFPDVWAAPIVEQ